MPAEAPDRRCGSLSHDDSTASSPSPNSPRRGPGVHAIAHLLSRGGSGCRHHGVYLVGPLETPLTHAMAAVLAYRGRGAAQPPLRRRSLARPHGAGGATMHVTVVGRDVRSRCRRDGAHSVGLPGTPVDTTRHHGTPSPPPPAPPRHPHERSSRNGTWSRAVDEARVQHLVTDHSLNEQFKRYPHHRGIRALRQAIQNEPAFTRSEAERRMLELILAAPLPEPETNAQSRRPRGGLPLARAAARRRGRRIRVPLGAQLVRARPPPGCRIWRANGSAWVRVTWRQIDGEPEATAAVARRRAGGSGAPAVRLRPLVDRERVALVVPPLASYQQVAR